MLRVSRNIKTKNILLEEGENITSHDHWKPRKHFIYPPDSFNENDASAGDISYQSAFSQRNLHIRMWIEIKIVFFPQFIKFWYCEYMRSVWSYSKQILSIFLIEKIFQLELWWMLTLLMIIQYILRSWRNWLEINRISCVIAPKFPFFVDTTTYNCLCLEC